jgi:hypothetical protein
MKRYTIILILVLLAVLAAGVPPCIASGSLTPGYSDTGLDTKVVSGYFESIRHNPNELRAFFHAMPKGGDIHNHLTGAVYAEDMIDIAARHGLLVDPATGQVATANSKASGLVPVSSAYNNMTLYSNLVDDWSMRDYPKNTGSGRKWFFATFNLFGPAKIYQGEMIATLRDRAAEEHVMYLETMMNIQGRYAQVAQVEANVTWDDNFGEMREDLLDAGLREICQQNAEALAAVDTRSVELAGQGGKNVTVRYIYQAGRNYPKLDVYTDLVLAFETANQSPLVAGINLVGEEDAYYARTDYHLQMEMIAYLHSIYPGVPIALHAGEQTIGLVPPEDLRFHVADAIHTGNASRIGHGVDIMYEDDALGTLADMEQKNIPVEILLTSNEDLLQLSGPEHPVSVYLAHHVPVVIGTDDPGVERTDLTEQYVELALQHPGVSYEKIREININGVRYSFLSEPEKEALLVHLRDDLNRFEGTIASRTVHFPYTLFFNELLKV